MEKHTEFYHLPGVETTEEERSRALEAVIASQDANATPRQSGYHVRAAAWTKNGIYPGGNMEYGLSDAFIHGESAAVTHAYAREKNPDIKAIGFSSEATTPDELIVRPCGNCRDILNDYVSPDTLIANGNEHVVMIGRLSSYLAQDFERAEDFEWWNEEEFWPGAESVSWGIDAFLPDELKGRMYGAVLLGKEEIVGSHYTNGAYDSTTPGVVAINALRYVGNVEMDLKRVVYAHFGDELTPPHVFYRDRQAMLEMDEVIARQVSRSGKLPVSLLSIDRDTQQVIGEWRTNTAEMLPYPFTPGEFGMDDAIEAQQNQFL